MVVKKSIQTFGVVAEEISDGVVIATAIHNGKKWIPLMSDDGHSRKFAHNLNRWRTSPVVSE